MFGLSTVKPKSEAKQDPKAELQKHLAFAQTLVEDISNGRKSSEKDRVSRALDTSQAVQFYEESKSQELSILS